MRRCQHCGAGVPNYAGFCGECGQLVSIGEPAAQERTLWRSQSVSPDQAQTTTITEAASGNEETGYVIEDEDTGKNSTAKSDAEEEEKKRRSVLLDFSLPLLADGIAGQSTLNVPMVQGTPPIVDAPTIPGTPSVGSNLPSAGESATVGPLILPDPQQVFTGSLVHGSHFNRPPTGSPYGANGPHPHGLNKPHPQPSGCMVWLLVAIIVPLIILASIIGVGFTLLAPTLSLEGNTSVTTGGTLHLQGGHFIPGDSVTCMLDGSIPLTYSSATYPVSGTPYKVGALLLAHQGSVTQQTVQTRETDAKTTIIVGGNGTFSVTFVVGHTWNAGMHTIRATEAFTPRSATVSFTVTGNIQPTSTTTNGATPIATKNARATPSVTPAGQTQPGLNAITPNIITFGPISEGYTQPTSTQVLLNTTGTDLLNWTASWDTIQVPWLRLNVQSGQIQEPNDQALIVSAVVGTLKAGTYNATITFSNNGKNELSLPVSLTVQAGCLKATPATLNFTATIGGNDPTAQTLLLNNCGAVGNWTESITGGSWLLVSPAGGNLNKGATQNIIVSATLGNVKSGAGTYQAQIAFKNGTAQATVNVIFTVLPLPTLGINTTSFNVRQQCVFSRTLMLWQCNIITLNSSQSATGNLDWTATSSSSGTATITVKPTGGTLQPGQTAPVAVAVARLVCDASTTIGTITFNGPANSIAVTLIC